MQKSDSGILLLKNSNLCALANLRAFACNFTQRRKVHAKARSARNVAFDMSDSWKPDAEMNSNLCVFFANPCAFACNFTQRRKVHAKAQRKSFISRYKLHNLMFHRLARHQVLINRGQIIISHASINRPRHNSSKILHEIDLPVCIRRVAVRSKPG